MTFFRWFKLNDKHRIIKGGHVAAASDEEALEKVVEEEDCPTCEVWQGDRKVGKVEAA